jgi:predicted O-linked N-acetylglucosamine transferase (SPINDLY family)
MKPNSSATSLDAAMQHHRAGRLQQAEELYRKFPQHPDALHLRGMIAHQSNRQEEALELVVKAILSKPSQASYYQTFEQVARTSGLDKLIEAYRHLLEQIPNNALAHNNLGNALNEAGHADDAIAGYRTAIALAPDFAEAHANLGVAYARQNKLEDALQQMQQAVALKPDFAPMHQDMGAMLARLGRIDEAIASFRKLLAIAPNAEAAYSLGSLLAQQGKLDDAIADYKTAIALQPAMAQAHAELGTLYLRQNKLAEAKAAYEATLALHAYPETLNNLGLIGYMQGRPDEAVAHYLKAIDLRPDFAEAYNNLGNALKTLERFDEAIGCYRQVVALQPDRIDTHSQLGSLLRRQGRYDDALHSYLQALALKPDNAQIHNNLGLLFADQKNDEEAFKCYQTALAIDPEMEEALINFGNLFYHVEQLEEAIVCFGKAIAAHPDSVDAWTNLGHAYHKQGQPDQAIACYRKAQALNPGFLNAHQGMLMAMQYSSSVTPEEMAAAHVAFGRQFETPLRTMWRPHANERDPGKRLKIGYLSADFRQHAVAYFIEPLLAQHDRSQFEVFCYYNHTQVDAATERLQQLADHWVNCRYLNDEQLAGRIRADGIDILIDLAGHTGGNRLLAFARKPAPVQVTYLGYPCTTGLTSMDYRITDVHAEPVGMAEALNTEQLWRLPEIFCCYRPHDNSPAVIDHPPVLDNGFITFGCFNNFAKVTDLVLTLWAQILARVPNSHLLLEIAGLDNGTLRADTETRLAQLGLPVERVVLVPRRPENQYVLYNHIDIALDPFPANGGTTSLDTLWMGVPFVTLAGRHFTSRMGVTILTNAGLQELIANSEDDYVDIVTQLATDLPRLTAMRAGLHERAQASPLMDASRFTRQLEQAYRGMWQAWCDSAMANHAAKEPFA